MGCGIRHNLFFYERRLDIKSYNFSYNLVFYSWLSFVFLQARIAFLQGERKGQENLKQDLVRRIKMLEFALKQER